MLRSHRSRSKAIARCSRRSARPWKLIARASALVPPGSKTGSVTVRRTSGISDTHGELACSLLVTIPRSCRHRRLSAWATPAARRSALCFRTLKLRPCLSPCNFCLRALPGGPPYRHKELHPSDTFCVKSAARRGSIANACSMGRAHRRSRTLCRAATNSIVRPVPRTLD